MDIQAQLRELEERRQNAWRPKSPPPVAVKLPPLLPGSVTFRADATAQLAELECVRQNAWRGDGVGSADKRTEVDTIVKRTG